MSLTAPGDGALDPLYTLDLRDPTAPKVAGELKVTGYSAYLHPISDTLLLGVGQEATEQDHHAFLWSAPANLAVLPVDTYDPSTESAFDGAVAFRVGTGGVGELGRIAHPAPAADRTSPPIGRSVVVGDRLLTGSATGIATNRLADLAPLAFTPLD